jgi:DNA-binding SARP family transcriptional activator
MRHGTLTMRLFGGFELRCDGRVVDLPLSVHRLLSFLALNDRRLPRRYVADVLWPDTAESKAHRNLRTALWRLNSLRIGLIDATPTELALNPAVAVDVRMVHEAARTYRRCGALPEPEALVEIHGELLPGCWDSWLIFDRERLRQEAVELLEAASRACLCGGRPHLAAMLCLGAVECDALRESANLLLVHICAVSGDRQRAIRHARLFADRLKEELGLPPPPALKAVLESPPNFDESAFGQPLKKELSIGP